MDATSPADAAFAHDAFLIERDPPTAGAGYRVRPLDADDRPGPPIALAPAGGVAGAALMRVRRTAPGAVGPRFEVTGRDGERIGVIEHRTTPTLFRASWAVLDPADGHLVAWAREQRVTTALARRLRDRLHPRRPSRTGGTFTLFSGQRPIGAIAQTGRDRLLDLRGDRDRTVDRRAAVALGVAIDALGRR